MDGWGDFTRYQVVQDRMGWDAERCFGTQVRLVYGLRVQYLRGVCVLRKFFRGVRIVVSKFMLKSIYLPVFFAYVV